MLVLLLSHAAAQHRSLAGCQLTSLTAPGTLQARRLGVLDAPEWPATAVGEGQPVVWVPSVVPGRVKLPSQDLTPQETFLLACQGARC